MLRNTKLTGLFWAAYLSITPAAFNVVHATISSDRKNDLISIASFAIITLANAFAYFKIKRQIASVHEAGHTIFQIFGYESGYRFQEAKIDSFGEGFVLSSYFQNLTEKTIEQKSLELYSKTIMSYAGKVAEIIIFGEKHKPKGFKSDMKQADRAASLIQDLSEKLTSLKRQDVFKNMTHSDILKAAERDAFEILNDRKDDLIRIAKALQKKRELSREDVAELVSEEDRAFVLG